MKRLLKGIIQWGQSDSGMLANNYQKLRTSKIQWVNPADEKIYKFVTAFFVREHDLPEARIVGGYFEETQDIEVVERLKDVKEAPMYEGANYHHVLKDVLEKQQRLELHGLLKSSAEANSKGVLTIKNGRDETRIEGTKHVLDHTLKVLSDFRVSIQTPGTERSEGDLREATKEAWEDYQATKTNPVIGKYCGIRHIDQVCKGLRKGELWIHAGHTGEGKTVFGLNWVYNLITRYNANAVYVSLEMSYKQIRNILCVMHSAHPRWEKSGTKPLDYRKVRDGELTKVEETFYKEVLDDLETNTDYCHLELWCPDHDVTVADIAAKLGSYHQQFEVGMACIDHAGLIKPTIRKSAYGRTDELTVIMQALKQLALTFEDGGMPLVALHQTNRDGKDKAVKNKGLYTGTSAMSQTSEVERSADCITTTYLDDDLRANGLVRIQNLKNRDNPWFTPIEVPIDWGSRTLRNPPPPGADMCGSLDELFVQLASL